MNRQDELIGEPVLIIEARGKKNEIGTILSINLENDEIMVGFNQEEQSSFTVDALMVLRDPAKIRVDADNDITLMPFWDHAAVMEITQLAESPQFGYRKFAIQLSLKNPEAMEYTMSPLRHELNLDRKHTISR